MTHLIKSPMGSVVWFSILSMSFSSKNSMSLTEISASSFVRTYRPICVCVCVFVALKGF